MNQEVIEYLQNQLVQTENRLLSYTKNDCGGLYPKRSIFIRVSKYIRDYIANRESSRWLIIPGLRGVGKTTLLAQLYLQTRKLYPEVKTLFLSLDELVNIIGSDLNSAMQAFEYLLNEKFEELEPLYQPTEENVKAKTLSQRGLAIFEERMRKKGVR